MSAVVNPTGIGEGHAAGAAYAAVKADIPAIIDVASRYFRREADNIARSFASQTLVELHASEVPFGMHKKLARMHGRAGLPVVQHERSGSRL
ncbi:MAG: hypothetical protein A4S14_05350 [Proteobacteria bacterium SG_bin9]|nr:MAG: hypothetical protein A4S14_05350 [Proteobacteria bacterium SG_bin9]